LRKLFHSLGKSDLILLDAYSVIEILDSEFGWFDSLGGDSLPLKLSSWRVNDNLFSVDKVGENSVFLGIFSVVQINNSAFLE
jgi:hypothetical protein